MDHKRYIKQILEFNKTAFDNAFIAMTTVQEQTGGLISLFAQQSPWLPEEGKKAMTQWERPCRKGRAVFKAAVHDNCKKAEDLISGF